MATDAEKIQQLRRKVEDLTSKVTRMKKAHAQEILQFQKRITFLEGQLAVSVAVAKGKAAASSSSTSAAATAPATGREPNHAIETKAIIQPADKERDRQVGHAAERTPEGREAVKLRENGEGELGSADAMRKPERTTARTGGNAALPEPELQESTRDDEQEKVVFYGDGPASGRKGFKKQRVLRGQAGSTVCGSSERPDKRPRTDVIVEPNKEFCDSSSSSNLAFAGTKAAGNCSRPPDEIVAEAGNDTTGPRGKNETRANRNAFADNPSDFSLLVTGEKNKKGRHKNSRPTMKTGPDEGASVAAVTSSSASSNANVQQDPAAVGVPSAISRVPPLDSEFWTNNASSSNKKGHITRSDILLGSGGAPASAVSSTKIQPNVEVGAPIPHHVGAASSSTTRGNTRNAKMQQYLQQKRPRKAAESGSSNAGEGDAEKKLNVWEKISYERQNPYEREPLRKKIRTQWENWPVSYTPAGFWDLPFQKTQKDQAAKADRKEPQNYNQAG
ncbi:unnamed protein product [Amoebophrya sp. A120]|nr:unnamed protein product [Amoebophrya sp. A120]|eukprot:GSA120T00002530001.1